MKYTVKYYSDRILFARLCSSQCCLWTVCSQLHS